MNQFALHETLELHEVTTFKSLCLTKAKAMQLLVSDPDLKALLQADIATSTRQLTELKGLLAEAEKQGAATV
jgi:similar to spore coat protein